MKFKQKFISSVLALGLVVSNLVVSSADTKTQQLVNVRNIEQSYSTSKGTWNIENGNWYFYKDGIRQIGWIMDNGIWYYTNSYGVMQTGWQLIDGAWYYLQSSGAMATDWIQLGYNWYHLQSSGIMSTGWLQSDGLWYFLNDDGAMHTGWLQSGYDWYYMQANGVMATGWQVVNGSWYYFYGSGLMATNITIDGWKIDASGVGTPITNNGGSTGGSNGGNQSNLRTVYVTPSGKSYHSTRDCTALKRSTTILSMSLQEAKNKGKSDPCNLCVR